MKETRREKGVLQLGFNTLNKKNEGEKASICFIFARISA